MEVQGAQPKPATDINEDEWKVIHAYADNVCETFGNDFVAAGDRFRDGSKLIGRFKDSVKILLSKGRDFVSGVDEAHNELCIASQLLKNKGLKFAVEYEPALPGSAKTIDFRAHADSGEILYIDVKTVKPEAKDSFEKFEEARQAGRLPSNINVTIAEDWLGGEMWHSMYAAREKMLEYALELEAKIRASTLSGDGRLFILALCGEGYYWHQDELEDFVAFYQSGTHRGDDAFSRLESHHIQQKGITVDRSITRFACLSRRQFEILPRRLNWNVEPTMYVL